MAAGEAVTAEAGARLDDVPDRGGISGAVVDVRLGVALGAGAMVSAAGLLGVVVEGRHLWWGVPLALVALGLSVSAVYRGIRGVIRYGLFTEGYGAAEVAGELHESRIAYAAGIISQVTLLLAGALTIALIVRAIF